MSVKKHYGGSYSNSYLVKVLQVKESLDGWAERPVEESVVKIPKYEVPFPSVTICPAGSK